MHGDLGGKNVVIVGGSSGIGWAIAELAAEAGASTYVLSRSGGAPKSSCGIAADVSDAAAIEKALRQVGEVHHIAYTAWARHGVTELKALTEERLIQCFAAKLFGALTVVRLALPHLAQEASITLTSGQVSRKYGVGTALKGAVNAAVDAAGKHLAKELAPRRVNVISPGVTDTSQWGDLGSPQRSEIMARIAAQLPVRRVATPREMAAAYLFAMGNSFVNGAILDVDGGGLL